MQTETDLRKTLHTLGDSSTGVHQRRGLLPKLHNASGMPPKCAEMRRIRVGRRILPHSAAFLKGGCNGYNGRISRSLICTALTIRPAAASPKPSRSAAGVAAGP